MIFINIILGKKERERVEKIIVNINKRVLRYYTPKRAFYFHNSCKYTHIGT